MKFIHIAALLALSACATHKEPLPVATTMSTITRLEYPRSAQTVGEAAEYILRPTGYHLVTTCPMCGPEARAIAQKPISPLALTPQTTEIDRALILIGGSRTAIMVDPDHHAIAYTWAGSANQYQWAGAAR